MSNEKKRAHPIIIQCGTPRLAWCDRCHFSHAFVEVWALRACGLSRIATWTEECR